MQHTEGRTGMSSQARLIVMALLAVLAGLPAAPAFAQNLANVPASSPLQKRVGAAVAAVCGQFIAANAASPATAVGRDDGTAQGDLFGRCGDMVHNANALLGSGPTAFSLGLAANSLNDALSEIAHDEAAAQGANSTQNTDIQVDNLTGRLAALRGGAKGVSLAALRLRDSSGQLLAADENWLDSRLAAGEDGGEAPLSRLGLFVTGEYSFGEDDGSREEAGYDFDGYGVTAGADYKLSENLIAGAAFGYTRINNDYDNNGGKLDQDTYSLSLYASIYSGPLYFDGIVSYALSKNDTDRVIGYGGAVRPVNRIARSDTDGEEFSISAGMGYEFSRGAWSFGPFARASYSDTDLDSYSETGGFGLNLAVDDQNVTSFETSLGGDVSYSHSTNFGVVIPNLRLEWVHEFDNDSRQIGAQYVNDPRNNRFFVRTDSPDRNSYILGGGLSAILAGGKTLFAEVESAVGKEDYERYVFRIGGRLEL